MDIIHHISPDTYKHQQLLKESIVIHAELQSPLERDLIRQFTLQFSLICRSKHFQDAQAN